MLDLIAQMRELEQRALKASSGSGARFEKRGQLLPRERMVRLLDPGRRFWKNIFWPEWFVIQGWRQSGAEPMR